MIIKDYSIKLFEKLNFKISKKIKQVFFLILFVGFSSIGKLNAATLYFNSVYKASGAAYTVNTQSLTSVSLVSGTSFSFTSADPTWTSFISGNNENGILRYVNGSGQLVSIYGTISRQNKASGTTLGVNFITTDSNYVTSASSEAYVLVVPGQEGSYSNGTTVSTSSDPIDPVLNAMLASQGTSPIMTISSPSISENAGYATFTISLSNAANASISFTPTLSDVSAILNSDYTNSIQYYNTTNSTWTNISSSVTINQGVTSLNIRVPILDDSTFESTETFNFQTGAITGGNVLNNYGVTGIGTILDNDSTPLSATTSQTNVSCNGGSNGSATVTASGGAAPYTYSWSPSGGTNATATGLTAGSYTVTITDANSSSISKTFTITQPSAIVSSVSSQTNVSCNGGSNGSATINVTGGTASYTYSWSPSGGTAATATGLAAGTYTVTITDANLCTKTQSVTITQPSAIVSSVSSQTNVSCNGGSNGSATVTASGGTGSLTYSWSP
ncbi:SprB repeat-containing protein, partial [Flavobacterium glycines]